jgi:hypothetical protein
MFVDAQSWPLGNGSARQSASFDRSAKSYKGIVLDKAVNKALGRHDDDLPIDQFRAHALALAFTPGEIFVDSHGVAKCDIHAIKLIMDCGFGTE